MSDGPNRRNCSRSRPTTRMPTRVRRAGVARHLANASWEKSVLPSHAYWPLRGSPGCSAAHAVRRRRHYRRASR